MGRLINLEFQRTSFKKNYIAVVIITICLIGMVYAMSSSDDINKSEAVSTITYDYLVNMVNLFGMLIFAILSSVIGSRIVVDEYMGKKAILLLTYPIKRSKIMNTKLFLLFTFTTLSYIVSSYVVIGAFSGMDHFMNLSYGGFTFAMMTKHMLTVLGFAVVSGFVGIMSTWVGMVIKSIPGTVVAACVLMGGYSAGINSMDDKIVLISVPIAAILGLMAWFDMTRRVTKMTV